MYGIAIKTRFYWGWFGDDGSKMGGCLTSLRWGTGWKSLLQRGWVVHDRLVWVYAGVAVDI